MNKNDVWAGFAGGRACSFLIFVLFTKGDKEALKLLKNSIQNNQK